MKTFVLAALLAACTSSVLAAPTIVKGTGFIGNISSQGHQSGGQEYVVLFDSTKPTPPDVAEVLTRIQLSPDHADVKYMFNNSAFGGFVANMKSHCIDALNAMEDVAHVEQTVAIKSHALQSRPGYPWGTQRISSSDTVKGKAKDARAFTYSFDDDKLGAGVDIYIIDTGVRTTHRVFEGRARQGFSFEQNTVDGDGHGTHVAGTAAGDFFGIASRANVWAVRVLNDKGSGQSSDTIAGMDWVINNHNKRKTEPGFVGSIMSMSWGIPGIADTVNKVILAASDQGIHVSVAAGNDNTDACENTPATNGGSKSAIISVGAIDIEDKIASFSNTGTCVDVYAPGVDILSSWATADNHIEFLSGTSMACPHVTGVMAYLMAQDVGRFGQDPKALKEEVLSLARKGAVDGSAITGDAKLLVSNGANGNKKKRGSAKWVVVDPEDNNFEASDVDSKLVLRY
ncbi:subtilisin-like protein [Delitschia confertaspora ATCC 74209]|uniref:Subtilisin-like protein n=1 Tax=Delitschia confertaspora ATCC 74209 TaxID=1513339 RepID=A0A9P4JPE5_9PLEO|nr:subtilisin-like protein [Delitschia confertaspora ATCC 74209]